MKNFLAELLHGGMGGKVGNHWYRQKYSSSQNCGSRIVQAAHGMQEIKTKKIQEPIRACTFSTVDTVELGCNATKGTEYLLSL
jgi:hypothetical protein